MTIAISPTITTREVAEVVLGVDKEAVEAFVQALPADQVASFVIRAAAVRAAFAFAAKAGERRLAVDGYVGQKYTDPDTGTAYLFTDSLRKKWKDVPGMVSSLEEQGIHAHDIFRAVSEMRVTDLRVLADSKFLSAEQKAECLRIIEDFRESVPSAPSFVEIDPTTGRIKR